MRGCVRGPASEQMTQGRERARTAAAGGRQRARQHANVPSATTTPTPAAGGGGGEGRVALNGHHAAAPQHSVFQGWGGAPFKCPAPRVATWITAHPAAVRGLVTVSGHPAFQIRLNRVWPSRRKDQKQRHSALVLHWGRAKAIRSIGHALKAVVREATSLLDTYQSLWSGLSPPPNAEDSEARFDRPGACRATARRSEKRCLSDRPYIFGLPPAALLSEDS